jgi:plasmid stabilization system protein ParE
MRLRWTGKASADLVRLYDFLKVVSEIAAARTIDALSAAPEKLLLHPRLGERLDEFSPKEVRRFLVISYEIQYEIRGDEIIALRLWHTREDR